MTSSDQTREVLELCREHGFALAGVASVEPSKWAAEVRSWLSAGKHGTMGYMEEDLEVRLDPSRIWQGSRSMVMVADVYAKRGDERVGEGLGRIARYARGRDYHAVIKKRLHAVCDELRLRFRGAAFRSFVDTAPVMEREQAARAGLGWIGKHTLLIHPRIGSYVLLGGFATTLALEPSSEPVEDHCGACTRCIDACPTKAISAYSVDGSRCISYLTIERRTLIDPALHEAMGDWLYGCDVCQEVCPHNSARAAPGPEPAVQYAAQRAGFDLMKVLGWTAEDRRQEFKGSSLKRVTLAMMKRNALIAAGNRGDPGLHDRIREIAADSGEPELVRNTARAVLSRLEARR